VKAELEPIGFTPETVLTIEDVARWLRVSKRHAESLNLPCVYLGTRTRRFLAGEVLNHLKALGKVA
jgi:hypothetical protein